MNYGDLLFKLVNDFELFDESLRWPLHGEQIFSNPIRIQSFDYRILIVGPIFMLASLSSTKETDKFVLFGEIFGFP